MEPSGLNPIRSRFLDVFTEWLLQENIITFLKHLEKSKNEDRVELILDVLIREIIFCTHIFFL